MTRHIWIAWKNIIHSRRQTIAVSLLALCAMTLMITGCFLGTSLQKGLTAAVEPFDMLAGYGGAYQMVLTTVFLQDYPAGNIPYRLVGELNSDPRVERAIPLAFGDNYRGYRIIGADAEIFSHVAKNGDSEPWLRFESGTPFSPGSHGAVIGGRAARDLGLSVGDSIVSSHGFVRGGEDHAHASYVVTGILSSCHGPYDQGVFVDLSTVWEAHKSEGSPSPNGQSEHEDDRRVTAIMVKPAGFADAYQLFAEFNSRHDAGMVFPAQVVVRLLSILGQADWLFRAIGVTAGIVASLTIALSLYWSAVSRAGEGMILSLIGAEKRDVTAILMWEGVLSLAPGLVGGCLVGHAVLAVISDALARKASLYASTGFSKMDLALGLILVVAGIVGEGLAALHMTGRKALPIRIGSSTQLGE